MSKKKKKRNEKNKKIQKTTKTKLKRQEEIQKVQLQLQQIGFSSDNPDIKYAYSIFNDYIEYGTAFTGKIKINGFQRVLDIILSNRSHIQTTICLQYNKEI